MKKFLLQIAIYVTLVALLLLIFDWIYTATYAKSTVRNKFQFVLNAPARHYDVLIIGSSRAENHLIPELFERRGHKTYNLAMSGANLCENALQLKLFFEKGNTAKNVLLQMDVNFQVTRAAEGIQAMALPYLPSNETIYKHYNDEGNTKDLAAVNHIPFYRYMVLDAKIGFREVLFTLFKKENSTISTRGFSGLDGVMVRGEKNRLPTDIKEGNKYYSEIKAICKANRANLIVFEAPFCSNVTNPEYFSRLKKQIPELYDYSNVITDDSLFASCGHMNEKGASIFSTFILDTHFPTKAN